MQRRHTEALAGVASGAVAFALYVWTLAPGLIDIRDTRRSSTWAGSGDVPITGVPGLPARLLGVLVPAIGRSRTG